MVKALLLDKKNQSQAPATVKAVEENCVTCGGAHSYQTYPATDGNVYRDNIQEYVSQAAADNLNQGNTGYRAPIANQIRPPDFPPAGFSSCNTVASDPINDLNANHYARSGVAYQGPTIPTTFSSTPLKNRKRCVEDTNLSKLGDKRVPFMVKEKHFVLASMISMLENSELRSDKAQVNCDCLELTQVDVIAKLPHPTTVKGVQSFLGHAAPILIAPDWDLPFELMCDASYFAIAYENSLIYKEKTKRIHDSKIKNRVFNVGDQVLLFNSRLKMFSGKLKSRWSGPFTITHVFPYGTVELSQNSGPNFKVLDLKKEKDAQAVEILKLKKRVKKLERQRKSSISHPRRRIYRQVKSSDDDLDEEDASKQGRTTFVQEKDVENQGKIGADDTEVVKGSGDTEAVNIAGEGVSTANVYKTVSTAAPKTPPTTTIVFDDEDVTIAMAQTLIKMKEEKAKEKGVAIKDVEDSSRPIRSITTLQPLPTIDPKYKGIVALRLQAELDEELRVERERQKEASKKYTIEERARLLAEFFERRKKQLAAERAEAIRNKPPTKTQLRNLMMTYLKNMGGYKHSQLKGKSYEEIQGLYERQQKRIQDFTPMDSEKEAQKPGKRLKRVAGSYATQKSPKKPKVMKSVTEEEEAEYEKEKKELRLSLKIISNDDSEVNYEPLSRKFPIMNWEYQLLGKMEEKDMYVYKLTRADGSSSYHGDTQAFLRRLDRQDLNDLYRLVQERFQDHPLIMKYQFPTPIGNLCTPLGKILNILFLFK
ncbi:hypothetical protein Tco_0265517 [Tanacetum coccineum]